MDKQNLIANMKSSKLRVPKGKYITESSTVDGPGFRDVLWVQGCKHHCEDCHNPETWDMNGGQIVTVYEVFRELEKSSITNVTFSGGDPLEQAKSLAVLAAAIKELLHKDIWIYSGYVYEDVLKERDVDKLELLRLCDVMVDGRFDKTKFEKGLKFRGSTNQRFIDLHQSNSTQTREYLF